jgi:hypothetical protein
LGNEKYNRDVTSGKEPSARRGHYYSVDSGRVIVPIDVVCATVFDADVAVDDGVLPARRVLPPNLSKCLICSC